VIDHGAGLLSSGPPVVIGAGSVVMANAVVRSSGGPHRPAFAAILGRDVLVGPLASLVGCTIEDALYIATGVMVFQDVVVGRASRLGAGCIAHVGARLAPQPAWECVGTQWHMRTGPSSPATSSTPEPCLPARTSSPAPSPTTRPTWSRCTARPWPGSEPRPRTGRTWRHEHLTTRCCFARCSSHSFAAASHSACRAKGLTSSSHPSRGRPRLAAEDDRSSPVCRRLQPSCTSSPRCGSRGE
jgi:carbonic anhydrase/acetyltransferase-like protein (isoleucine patch superfamily)